MNQLAVASFVGLLLVGAGAAGTIAYQETTAIAAARAQLNVEAAGIAHDRALFLQADKIRHAYAASGQFHPSGNRRLVLEGLRKFKGISLRGFKFGINDGHFKVEIAGAYPRLISVIVGFPATVTGLTIDAVDLSVDRGKDGAAQAAAEISGTLS